MRAELKDFAESSPQEQTLKAAIIGKTKEELFREYEIESFYDKVEQISTPRITAISFDACPFFRLTIVFLVDEIQFQPLQTNFGNPVQYPIRIARPVEHTIVFNQEDLVGNVRLFKILKAWDAWQHQFKTYGVPVSSYSSRDGIASQLVSYFQLDGEML